MAMSLTHQQAALLDFVVRYQEANGGVSPSFEEMVAGICVGSKSHVHRILQSLEERGRIRRPYGKVRAIEIIPADPFAGISTQAIYDELARRGMLPLGLRAA